MSKKHGTADAARFQPRTGGVVVDADGADVGEVLKVAAGGRGWRGCKHDVQESDREKLASLVDEVTRGAAQGQGMLPSLLVLP